MDYKGGIMEVEIKKGRIYFIKNGIIETEEMLQHGSMELIFQNGDVVYINKTTKKKL